MSKVDTNSRKQEPPARFTRSNQETGWSSLEDLHVEPFDFIVDILTN